MRLISKMIDYMKYILNIMENYKVGDGMIMLMSNYLKLNQFQT